MKKFAIMICVFFCIMLCSCRQKESVPFSNNVDAGESVYVDVVSIVPKHTLTSGTSVTDVVCECTTLSGETVWVCLSTRQYQNLDPSASFSNYLGNFYSGAFYPDGVRIQGRTISAEKKVSGLAAMTAPVIIDYYEVAEVPMDSGDKIQPMQYTGELSATTPVYADIVSLVPYKTIADNSHHVQFIICLCTTPSGETAPLYISVRDYKAHFDPNADFSIFDVMTETVELTNTARVYGLLVSPDDLAGDLSGEMPYDLLVFHSCEIVPEK